MVLAEKALEFAGAAGQQLFPIGRAIKLVRQGTKIVNSTNPLTVTANITLTVTVSGLL